MIRAESQAVSLGEAASGTNIISNAGYRYSLNRSGLNTLYAANRFNALKQAIFCGKNLDATPLTEQVLVRVKVPPLNTAFGSGKTRNLNPC